MKRRLPQTEPQTEEEYILDRITSFKKEAMTDFGVTLKLLHSGIVVNGKSAKWWLRKWYEVKNGK